MIFGRNKRGKRVRGRVASSGPSFREMYGLSHVDDGALVSMDGRRVSVFEIGGKEFSIETVSGFARTLNTLDYNLQILVRQHRPYMSDMRAELRRSRESSLTPRIDEAADSMDQLLLDFERRDDIFDRRFYLACEERSREKLLAELRTMDVPVRLLSGEDMRRFAFCVLSGCSPKDPTDADLRDSFELRVKAGFVEDSRGRFRRTFAVRRWPRALSLGFVQRIMRMGIPMDFSMHISAMDGDAAASKLEYQKIRMESSRNMSIKQGRSVDPTIEIAIEDIMRLRDAVQRGIEKMFDVSVSVTIHADTRRRLDEYSTMLSSHFTSVIGQMDGLYSRQLAGGRATFPLASNPVGEWSILDTSSLSMLFPFNPPDLDKRKGTLFGLDLRASTPVIFDVFRDFPNHNMAVLATSGAGKSFSVKLAGLRDMTRGVRLYIIDPEGEYVDMAEYAGGRVMTPGVPGQGMNPFTISNLDAEDTTFRIGNLQRVVRMMIGDHLDALTRGALDHALTEYYASAAERERGGEVIGFRSFCRFLESDLDQQDRVDIARMLRPFSSGSLRHLLTDEGQDLLVDEPMITVFDLHLIEDEMRAVAAMICTETVWAMAARDPRPRRLIVDEVWSIIKHAAGADFMLNVAKRARKHRFGVTSITQDVQDLLARNEVGGVIANSGRALLQNASLKLLLKQDSASVEAIRETFNLPEEQARALVSNHVGQGLLVASNTFIPVQIEATDIEAEVIEWKAGRDRERFGYGPTGSASVSHSIDRDDVDRPGLEAKVAV